MEGAFGGLELKNIVPWALLKMKKFFRYWTIFWVYFRVSLIRELAFRLNFFAGIAGSFAFVILNLFIIYFLMQKITIGKWTEKEMLVLLGNFFIIFYSFFFFFWRGFIWIPRNIRDGRFDFSLLLPVDLQFIISILGGGVHNLLAIFFGIFLTAWGVKNLGINPSFLRISLALLSLIASTLDFYSLILLLMSLNFRFGYLEEISNFVLSFQNFSRYPLDAYLNLPVQLLIFAIPFSALSTIPTIILIDSAFPLKQFLFFMAISLFFIYLSRRIFYKAVKNYSSAG